MTMTPHDVAMSRLADEYNVPSLTVSQQLGLAQNQIDQLTRERDQAIEALQAADVTKHLQLAGADALMAGRVDEADRLIRAAGRSRTHAERTTPGRVPVYRLTAKGRAAREEQSHG